MHSITHSCNLDPQDSSARLTGGVSSVNEGSGSVTVSVAPFFPFLFNRKEKENREIKLMCDCHESGFPYFFALPDQVSLF